MCTPVYMHVYTALGNSYQSQKRKIGHIPQTNTIQLKKKIYK